LTFSRQNKKQKQKNQKTNKNISKLKTLNSPVNVDDWWEVALILVVGRFLI
jgi:hypothetical protein